MREIEIEINQEIEINTDGYIVIFNYTNYYYTKFLSCLGGGGGGGVNVIKGKIRSKYLSCV